MSLVHCSPTICLAQSEPLGPPWGCGPPSHPTTLKDLVSVGVACQRMAEARGRLDLPAPAIRKQKKPTRPSASKQGNPSARPRPQPIVWDGVSTATATASSAKNGPPPPAGKAAASPPSVEVPATTKGIKPAPPQTQAKASGGLVSRRSMVIKGARKSSATPSPRTPPPQQEAPEQERPVDSPLAVASAAFADSGEEPAASNEILEDIVTLTAGLVAACAPTEANPPRAAAATDNKADAPAPGLGGAAAVGVFGASGKAYLEEEDSPMGDASPSSVTLSTGPHGSLPNTEPPSPSRDIISPDTDATPSGSFPPLLPPSTSVNNHSSEMETEATTGDDRPMAGGDGVEPPGVAGAEGFSGYPRGPASPAADVSSPPAPGLERSREDSRLTLDEIRGLAQRHSLHGGALECKVFDIDEEVNLDYMYTGLLALDCEFKYEAAEKERDPASFYKVRKKNTTPKVAMVALLQLADCHGNAAVIRMMKGDEKSVILPPAVLRLIRSAKVLVGSNIPEDIRAIERHFGHYFDHWVDLQEVALVYVDHHLEEEPLTSPGLENLCHRFLEVDLPNKKQKPYRMANGRMNYGVVTEDWGALELTSEQLEYAMNDGLSSGGVAVDMAIRYLRPRAPRGAGFTLAEVVAAAADHLLAFKGRERRATIERYSQHHPNYMPEFE